MSFIPEAESKREAALSDIQKKSLPIRQFLLGNLFTPEGQKTKKFRVPIDVLGKALANMGDFPYKDPGKARFEKPALFVRGTTSKYVPDEVLPAVGEFFPRFEVVDVEAGHWLISENPEAFRQGESRCECGFLLAKAHEDLLLMLTCCTAVVQFLGPKE